MGTAFSDFFRNASPEEKKRVYTEVAKAATEKQSETLRAAKMARKQREEHDETSVMEEEAGFAGDDWQLIPDSEYYSARRKDAQRDELAKLTNEYLARGGQIEHCAEGDGRYEMKLGGAKWNFDPEMSIIGRSQEQFKHYQATAERMLKSGKTFTIKRMASAAGCTRGVMVGVLRGPLKDDLRAQTLLALEGVE